MSADTAHKSGHRRADDEPGMREFLEFLRKACKLLVECGCSSNRVELLTQKLGASWGFEVETLAIPTGVWITVRRGHVNVVDLTRVRSWSIDLGRLTRINALVEAIYAHRISIEEATSRLDQIGASAPPYGMGLTLLAGAGTSPILIYAYGGAPLEVALAFPIGAVVQIMQKYLFVGEENRRNVADFLSSIFVALYACAAKLVFPEVDVPRLIVGGIVVLVPGLVLVNAIHEVAQKNLVSGAAKLLEALVTTATLGCGVLFVLGLFYVWS
jgi:uncharacterized membrane protein YjjP (DUF1212 family)